MPLIPDDKLPEHIALGKYPHYYSCPVFTYDPFKGVVKNGTLTLIESENGIIGITCAHVLDYYTSNVERQKHLQFQIGLNIINPNDHLIDYDQPLDLCTFRIDPSMVNKMKGESYPEMGGSRVTRIYQEEIKDGDKITFGGLPGKWTELPEPKFLRFETFTVVRGTASSSGISHYTCQLDDPDAWPVQVTTANPRPAKSLRDLGGISGGPAFILSNESTQLELAGIIYEGKSILGGTTLVIYLRPAKMINFDGSLNRDYAHFRNHLASQVQEDQLNLDNIV